MFWSNSWAFGNAPLGIGSLTPPIILGACKGNCPVGAELGSRMSELLTSQKSYSECRSGSQLAQGFLPSNKYGSPTKPYKDRCPLSTQTLNRVGCMAVSGGLGFISGPCQQDEEFTQRVIPLHSSYGTL